MLLIQKMVVKNLKNMVKSMAEELEDIENKYFIVCAKSNDLLKKTARAIDKSAHFPPNFWLFSMNLAAHVLMFSMPKLLE